MVEPIREHTPQRLMQVGKLICSDHEEDAQMPNSFLQTLPPGDNSLAGRLEPGEKATLPGVLLDPTATAI